jgi:hypothetical protein
MTPREVRVRLRMSFVDPEEEAVAGGVIAASA